MPCQTFFVNYSFILNLEYQYHYKMSYISRVIQFMLMFSRVVLVHFSKNKFMSAKNILHFGDNFTTPSLCFPNIFFEEKPFWKKKCILNSSQTVEAEKS